METLDFFTQLERDFSLPVELSVDVANRFKECSIARPGLCSSRQFIGVAFVSLAGGFE